MTIQTAAPTNAVKERGAGLEVGAPRPVRERPIPFSGEMVRALLAGTKTQTRRGMQVGHAPDNANVAFDEADGKWYCDGGMWLRACPYGVPGDRLWVKETWRPNFRHEHNGVPCDCNAVRVDYLADGGWKEFAPEAVAADWTMPKAAMRGSNVTPRFMPRWASRITLEVTEVRVQRLQDISEADAVAEGVAPFVTQETWSCMSKDGSTFDCCVEPTEEWPKDIIASVHRPAREWHSAKESYRRLWNEINGAGSWDANGWVWAVSFRVLP